MAKEYIVEANKYEKKKKKIGKGMDFLDDNKVYRLQFHANGLIQAIRVKKAFERNEPFRYYTYWKMGLSVKHVGSFSFRD